jgi:O-antigen/teichoic acid export membrane protein
MARMRQESNAKYRDALLKIFRTFGVMAIIAALLTAMFSSLIVSLLYGPSYARSGPILAIHVFTNLFVFQGVAQTLWLLNQGLGIYSLYKTAIGALVAILANYLLIPRYGLYGAAISANISYASSAVLSNLWLAPDIFKMQLGINPGPANEKRF